jgi:hypothetical protein
MKSIWKFPIEIKDRQNLLMPEGAEILTAQVQGQSPCLWALVNPNARKTVRTIAVNGTGHPIEDDAERHYIGTIQMGGGVFVWHVFEEL